MTRGSPISKPCLRLQERDLAVLRGLFESRIATLRHLTDLYFDGRSEACKKRVQSLKRAGYIRERPRRHYAPSILFLGKAGFEALQDYGAITEYPQIGWSTFEKRARVSEATLRHELQVMDVKAAFCSAVVKEPHLNVAEFSTWPRLYQFRARPEPGSLQVRSVLVKPDGFIRLREREANARVSEHLLFLEVDRSTETLDTLAKRSLCYLDYYCSGGMAVRFGDTREAYKDYPFRVIILCSSEKRCENVARRLLANNPPTLRQVWLSTTKDFLANPIGATWTRPIDWRDRDLTGAAPHRTLTLIP